MHAVCRSLRDGGGPAPGIMPRPAMSQYSIATSRLRNVQFGTGDDRLYSVTCRFLSCCASTRTVPPPAIGTCLLHCGLTISHHFQTCGRLSPDVKLPTLELPHDSRFFGYPSLLLNADGISIATPLPSPTSRWRDRILHLHIMMRPARLAHTCLARGGRTFATPQPWSPRVPF